MEYSITGSEVAELISCKKQDVYNSASYGQMIRKEFYVEVVDRPLSRTKDLTLLGVDSSENVEFKFSEEEDG